MCFFFKVLSENFHFGVLKSYVLFSSEVKQKMMDAKLAEEQAQAQVKKKRRFKNPFKKRPKTREEKIEAWLEN